MTMIHPQKPQQLHDREASWDSLVNFLIDPRPGAKLGLVYGRRRQGKTLLLELLAQLTGGLMFTALPQSSAQNLQRLAQSFQAYAGGLLPSFPNWDSAIEALMSLGEQREDPTLIVIDEFQYLSDITPELPSIIQIALSPAGRAASHSKTRLVLCGSALSTMHGLLAGGAPLRGRAALEMMIHPFGYRDSASFWGLNHTPELAFRVNALLGGTPAYRSMANSSPSTLEEFDDWVINAPLNPDSALFREGAVLLREQPEINDTTLYHSVLSAIAQGRCRRSEIAGVLARSENSLSHPLAVLEHIQLIERVEEAFRQRRPVYRITEPMIRLHQLVIGPNEALLVGRAGDRVWRALADTVSAKIYGPHLEELARQWTLHHAGHSILGGEVNRVAPATLACAEHREGHELDLVALQREAGKSDTVLAIGEAKATNKLVGAGSLARLEHLRDLLPAERTLKPPRLFLFSRHGFTQELSQIAAKRNDVELIGLERLYDRS